MTKLGLFHNQEGLTANAHPQYEILPEFVQVRYPCGHAILEHVHDRGRILIRFEQGRDGGRFKLLFKNLMLVTKMPPNPRH